MLSPRINKIIRDLWRNRARAILTLFAMIVGIIGVGAILCAYSILVREMDANYMLTRPASASLSVNLADAELIDGARHLPGIGEVEARGFFCGRIEVAQNEWRTLWLFVVPDFERQRLDAFTPEQGAWPPKLGDMLLERTAFRVAKAKIGDARNVVIPGHEAVTLRITGSVHAPGEAPAWMENLVYGYITPETLGLLGETTLNELNFTVSENAFDLAHVKRMAQQVATYAEQRGYAVNRVSVPLPGKHPHASQMAALLFLLEAFGLLAFALSSVIVINVFSATLAQQIRQIGVMKTLGARGSQIMSLYLGQVLLLAVIALIIGLPAAMATARLYSNAAATMLNFTIRDASVSAAAYLAIITIGLTVPMLAAAFPIYRGSRMTVKAALSDYGIGAGQFELNSFFLWLSEKIGVSRPMLLSIRNTFRRHGRVALTVATLAIGGAIFMASLNIGASITRTVAVIGEHLRYDIEISLAQPAPRETVNAIMASTPDVQAFEGWGEARGAVVRADGTTGEAFQLIAPLAETKLFVPQVIAGRWLLPEDAQGMVISHAFKLYEPELQVGSEMIVRMNGRAAAWKIVGIVQQLGPPVAYVSYAAFAAQANQAGMVSNVRIAARDKDAAAQLRLTQRLEQQFKQAGIPIAALSTVGQYRKVLEDHFLIIVSFLLLMSALIVLVGGLGLMTTMSIQVIERTREIGVMRALGASGHALMFMIQNEGRVIGLISWVIAAALSFPVSYCVGNAFGNIFFRAPLNFAIAPLALPIWFAVIFIFAFVACVFPALKAIRLTVRETLAYE